MGFNKTDLSPEIVFLLSSLVWSGLDLPDVAGPRGHPRSPHQVPPQCLQEGLHS